MEEYLTQFAVERPTPVDRRQRIDIVGDRHPRSDDFTEHSETLVHGSQEAVVLEVDEELDCRVIDSATESHHPDGASDVG